MSFILFMLTSLPSHSPVTRILEIQRIARNTQVCLLVKWHLASYIMLLYRMSVYELPWPILSTHLTGVITVTEEEIITAMKLVSQLMNIIVDT